MMQGFISALAAAAVVLSACASDDGSPANAGDKCADIAGNYNVKVSTISGDCPPGDGKDIQITIGKSSAGYEIVPQGSPTGCPSEFSPKTCRLTATCVVTDTTTGQNVATFNHDYTFSGATFKGTVAGSLRPPLADPACRATARHEGGRLQ